MPAVTSLLLQCCQSGLWAEQRSDREKFACCAQPQHQPGPATTSQFNEPGDAWSAAWRAAWRPVCLCSKAPTEAWASFPCSFTGRLHCGDSVVLTSAHSPIWFNAAVEVLAKNWYLMENSYCNVWHLIGPGRGHQQNLTNQKYNGTNIVILVVGTLVVSWALSNACCCFGERKWWDLEWSLPGITLLHAAPPAAMKATTRKFATKWVK